MPELAEVVDGFQMPLAEAMRTQRAVRRLKLDPVDDETVLELLRLAVRAPTGSNAQGWEFLVVRDPDVKHQLARLNRQAWSLYRRMARSRARGDISQARILAAVQWQADHFEDAPVIVVACLKGRSYPMNMGRAAYYGSIFPAVQKPAPRGAGPRARGRTHHAPALVPGPRPAHADAPKNVTPCAVIPLGWPMGGGYGPTTRRPVEEVTHLDRYGNRVFLGLDGHAGDA